MISSSQRPLPDNTRLSQQTNIHAPGGMPAAVRLLRSWVRSLFICAYHNGKRVATCQLHKGINGRNVTTFYLLANDISEKVLQRSAHDAGGTIEELPQRCNESGQHITIHTHTPPLGKTVYLAESFHIVPRALVTP